jgi:benzil reductase ((S)-benzoin forming)
MGDLVIVTGASRGLGLALAGSVPFPARIVDVSRSGPPEAGGIDHIAADLAAPDSLLDAAQRIGALVEEERPGRCVLIHAAGTLNPIGFAGEVETGEYARSVLLNAAAGQILGQAFLAALADMPGTHDLVMITSGAAHKVYEGWSAYCAGKAALDRWVAVAGAEQARRGGVRVSAISPGVLDTAMQEEIRRSSERDFPDIARFRALHTDQELVDPRDAAIALWELIETGVEPGAILDLRNLD